MSPPAPRVLRYAVTAGAAAAVDLGGFVVLMQGAGLAVAPSAAASFLAATGVNYALTARFVFADRAGRGYPAFLAAASAGAVLNVAVTTLAATRLGVPPAAAKALGIGLAFGVNYALTSALVFPPRRRG